MKIIARIDGDRILVEMTERELAHVAGRDFESQLRPQIQGYGKRIEGTEVGTEYDVAKAWFRLQAQAQAAEKLEGVSKTLTALAYLVTLTKVTFTNCTAEQEGGAK